MKMHVAVAGWLLGSEPSGANRRLLSILRAMEPLLEHGERVTVLHRPGALPDDPPAAIRWHPIEIPAAPTWRRVLGEHRALRASLAAEAATLLELGTLPVLGRMPCPVSLTLHDLRDVDGPGRRPRWLSRWVLRRSLRRAACVTVPSEFTAERLTQALGGMTPRLTVIPGGVADEFLDTWPTPPRERPYFLHVGHLETRKNLLLVLSAYADLLDDETDAADDWPALRFVGTDHGDREELAERAAFLDLTGHVDFAGAVTESELLAQYAGATALLFPSLHEGFGLPALEGLAVGVPVLVSDRGALPEVVGSHGIVLPSDDVRAWSDAMRQVCAAGSSRALIESRKAHARRFSWRRSAQATLDVWRKHSR